MIYEVPVSVSITRKTCYRTDTDYNLKWQVLHCHSLRSPCPDRLRTQGLNLKTRPAITDRRRKGSKTHRGCALSFESLTNQVTHRHVGDALSGTESRSWYARMTVTVYSRPRLRSDCWAVLVSNLTWLENMSTSPSPSSGAITYLLWLADGILRSWAGANPDEENPAPPGRLHAVITRYSCLQWSCPSAGCTARVVHKNSGNSRNVDMPMSMDTCLKRIQNAGNGLWDVPRTLGRRNIARGVISPQGT